MDRGARVVVLGLNGAGKTTLLRLLAGLEQPDTGRVMPGHGLRLGYYAQEHETLDAEPDRAGEHALGRAGPVRGRAAAASSARSCSPATTWPSPPACCPAARRPGSRWPCWWCPGPTCCCSTSRPTTWTRRSRAEILSALRRYRGAIVLVTHDEGAVEALSPERVVLLPDGVEDAWSEELADLVALA